MELELAYKNKSGVHLLGQYHQLFEPQCVLHRQGLLHKERKVPHLEA